MALLLIRYDEIALKGGNRVKFENQLARNLTLQLSREIRAPVKVRKLNGRLMIESKGDEERAISAATRVAGVTSISPVTATETDWESLPNACADLFAKEVERFGLPTSFKVSSRRSEKVIPIDSPEIDRIIGSLIFTRFPGMKVQLKKPALTLHVEIRRGTSYLYTQVIPGVRGLPVGSNGKLLVCLSGGIDSPVAATQILKRGCPTVLLHFHGTPFIGDSILNKVSDLKNAIDQYAPEPQPLIIVPFGALQEIIALKCPASFRTLLYRRLMFKIASKIAIQEGALGIVTGECIGQVASQTIENMAVVDFAAELPVFRPLLTWDKDDIVTQARKIGTFSISTIPEIDCCTLFADRQPVIRAQLGEIERIEAELDCASLVQRGVDESYPLSKRQQETSSNNHSSSFVAQPTS